MGSVFKKVNKIVTDPLRDQAEQIGKIGGSFLKGVTGGDAGSTDSGMDEAAVLAAEAEEDKRRKLLAEQSLTQTSPTGAGKATTGRATVTGV